MADYHAPLDDMRFIINEVLDADTIGALPGFEDFDADTLGAVLEEAGRFATQVLAPINKSGDAQGVRWHENGVDSADGFADAYARYVDAGWNSVTGAPEHGGMGMPALLGAACQEMWNGANMSFALCPLLTASAVKLLSAQGSDEQKAVYLDKLISGEWTGTMDLTEPQAGSDLSAIRTRAKPDGDHYRLFGQKIYITWGEHDMADNIVHLVLARLPDAPAGVKGISLFVVPKFLVNDDGQLGARNDMRCAAIEHKLGIHASPTCTMAYGDGDGAIGDLVGEANRGLGYMFIMMNEARQKMGVQGLAVADAAYQHALAHARERVQGQPAAGDAPAGAPIAYHPDVRRMLMSMRTQVDAMRALAYDSAAQMDIAARHTDASVRERAQARADLLIPITKAWCTEVAIEITSIGIQVHGGMGFVEETGAAQFFRDVRIAAIYEGTNGIQANDLVGRKVLRDQGTAMTALIADMRETCDALDNGAEHAALARALKPAVARLEDTTQELLHVGADDPPQALANAFNYLMQAGYVVGGWYQARMALTAAGAGDESRRGFYEAKIAGARFYSAQILPRAHGYAEAVMAGSDPILAVDVEHHL